MKKLLLLFLFSGSLDSFSQAVDSTLSLRQFDVTRWSIKLPDTSVKILTMADFYPAPDTLRATLVVYYDRGPAILHTKPGFVVFKGWEIDRYLDDRKRVIKGLEVWGYKLKK